MTTVADATVTEVFFDFLCPFAWRGVELADVLRRERGLSFRLRHFSLVQGNHPENPDRKAPTWWLHEQPQGEGGAHQQASLRSFLAAGAAAEQGEEAGWAFTLALFRARFERKAELDEQTVQDAVRVAGLDPERFATDLADEQARRDALAGDLRASSALGVFGTPTFVLPDGNAAYLRFSQLVREAGQAEQLWNLYTEVLHSGAGIETIKRPR
ncbi:DsbA family oxidoreductase [Deinococcus hopiensis]|uniref:Predicted dithiol-disulfide isomerase, DsbA family n=1 Tax=Deinococcus hopiensis KR-140 TaxID=695939 RepID=A0A1W1UHK3_9DEIO|nr:DsbA family protein [Deinococcus hopiensis]SMB80608.1 Predicted dithiol-disulfide isomerase, DsbA family [Deinococcus hopiensis KR-140]